MKRFLGKLIRFVMNGAAFTAILALGWAVYHQKIYIPFLSSSLAPFEAVFPKSVKVSYLFHLENLPENIRREKIRFSVNGRGRPYFLVRDRLVELGAPKKRKPRVLRSRMIESADHLAWMKRGLVAIEGSRFGVLDNKGGMTTLLDLPEEGMKLRPAGRGLLYLYGGESDAQRRNLYVYERKRGLIPLLRAPAPIHVVAGNGKFTFLAIGDSIYLFGLNKPLTPIYTAGEKIISLAMSPPSGLFYSTENQVGYVSGKLRGYTFLRGKGGELHVSGRNLYLFFRDEGVLKASPVSAFRSFASSFKKLASKK